MSYSNMKLINFEKVIPTDLKLGPFSQNKNGVGRTSYLNYQGNKYFNIVLIDMRFPFGASAKPSEFQRGDKKQYTIQCELTEQQIEKFKQLDEHVIDSVLKMSDICQILNIKSATREVIESKYYPLLKYSKDKTDKTRINTQFPPTIRVNLQNNNTNGFDCQFFQSKSTNDNTSQKIEIVNDPGNSLDIMEFIPSGSRGSILVSLSVWLTGSGFGVSMKANQIKMEYRKRLAKGVCLLEQLIGSNPNDNNVNDNNVNDNTDELSELEELEEFSDND